MTDRDRDAASPGAVVTIAVGLGLALAAVFVASFVLPKVEARYLTTGARPPFPLVAAIGLSQWVMNDAWVLVAAGFVAFGVRRATSPSRAEPRG